jgi:hypothetical protein
MQGKEERNFGNKKGRIQAGVRAQRETTGTKERVDERKLEKGHVLCVCVCVWREIGEGCINSCMYDRWEEYICYATRPHSFPENTRYFSSRILLILTAFLVALKSI